MITTYELPNQWNWRLFLSISNEGQTVLNTLQHLNTNQNCKFDLNVNDNSNIQAPCFISDQNNLIGVICLNQYQFDTHHIMICVHQLIHEMILISEISGCQINSHTSECWAYFIGNMIQMILQVLNLYKERENNEQRSC